MKKSMWKKLMSTILALVMVLGLSGTLGFQHVDATENSGFTFLPDKTEVKRGDIVTYSIDLAKNAKIAGITAQFTFDPDVLEALGDGVDAKGYVKNAVKKGNVSEGTFGDFYVNTDGRIGIVAILNDNDKDKLADGNVAKISFKVKDTAKGDIGLKVKNLEFCDVNSEDIPTSEISVTKDNDAQIKVVVPATGITVDKTATTIVKGATDKLTAMVYAVKAGKADVTATTKAVDNATAKPFTATTTVTVKENSMTDEIGKKLAFDEFDDLLIGQKDNANNYLNLSELIEANNITDDINVEFASSDKAVATIDNDGNVFGLKAGKTIITATVTAIAGDGSKNVYTAEGELTVKAIPLNSIAFDKVIKEMKLGATDTLSIIYNPQNTTDAKDVTWTSSNPSVISVENGKLTANAVGTADITAKVGDKTVTCTITVKEEKKAEQPKPDITNKKSDNKLAAKSVSKANDTKKAKTGDNNNVILFLVMFAAAVAMIGVITGKSLRRNRR